MSVVHRYGMTGGAQCGAVADKFGHLKISTSGVVVTCPACKPVKASREATLAAIRRAANNPSGPDAPEPCVTCDGTGTGWKQADDPFGERECPRCQGTGDATSS